MHHHKFPTNATIPRPLCESEPSTITKFCNSVDRECTPTCSVIYNNSSYLPSTSSENTIFMNQAGLHMDFTSRESPSESIKCKAFWQYVDTRPDLEALKTLCFKEADEATQMPSPLSQIVRHPWLHQLMGPKIMNLHDVALAGYAPRINECDQMVFADMVDETPRELMARIEDFEKTLARREAERGPNQAVLGYKNKQPPPRIPN